MTKDSTQALGTLTIRALNGPQELIVRTAKGSGQTPGFSLPDRTSAFFVKKPVALRLHGRWFEVESVEDMWRIDDEWWRERAVSRMYYMCTVDSGMAITVFHDLIGGKWYRQG